ncbi:MAG: SUF system NifU family Fe-S cluster assembly protein [Deltaproteobacteria bacterium]|nr:SUF system NifU family Fe-S cluster assembly protein [Deltaproteobacteria bacterium]
MTTAVIELYREVILDHSKHPRNCRALRRPARVAEGYNPLCGDQVTVYVELAAGVLREVAFQGRGCALSTASASLMTEMLKGKSAAAARRLGEQFENFATTGAASAATDIGQLNAFAAVHKFPSRVKCALLAWRTLQAALRAEEPATAANDNAKGEGQ